MLFTIEAYNKMVERCKAIAVEFKQRVAEQRASLISMEKEDIDDFGVSEEEIQSLLSITSMEYWLIQ